MASNDEPTSNGVTKSPGQTRPLKCTRPDCKRSGFGSVEGVWKHTQKEHARAKQAKWRCTACNTGGEGNAPHTCPSARVADTARKCEGPEVQNFPGSDGRSNDPARAPEDLQDQVAALSARVDALEKELATAHGGLERMLLALMHRTSTLETQTAALSTDRERHVDSQSSVVVRGPPPTYDNN